MKSKRSKGTKRHSKLLLKLSSWGNYIDEAYQLESILAKKPARLQIEFVGSGEIPPDSALLMRSMLLKRSPQTRIVTNARSSLQGASLLIWLLGDTRLIRTANPFRKEGRAATDLTSTHPPTTERIRILRSMAGGASLAAYNLAYSQVSKSGKGVVPRSALVGETAVAARQASAAEPQPEKVERVRETSELMWKMSNYGLVNCQCGTRIRVPPNFKGPTIRCPHCGTVNGISSKH